MKTLLSPLFLCLLFSAQPPAMALENRLATHPSPYLAMHGQDPTAWQDWGPEVLELARQEGRLIYLSSGYFACHWCHVMQRESYQDPEVADFINRHFVPVKLDRELQPALDAHLIRFVERTRGQAGWPLNVLLTPDGYPVIGFTYAPRDQFLGLLQRVQGVWQEDRPRVEGLARQAADELLRETEQAASGDPAPVEEISARLDAQTEQVMDELQGGFGNQSRFPMAPQLLALLERQAVSPDPRRAAFLRLTLDQMAEQGLRDHLGGGFFRYTVDPDWQTPHFEKMLYTQALLARLYLNAAQVLDRPEYAGVARDTLDFVLRDMRGEQGGYVASFSAVDGQGVEGGYYLWSRAELESLLDDRELAVLRRYWRLGETPNFDAGRLPLSGESLLETASALGLTPDLAQAAFVTARDKLLAARGRRELPVDTKELMGWNALLLSSLSGAAEQLGDERYSRAAHELRDFLVNRLWGGLRMVRARDQGRPVGEPALEDYAYLARGLWDHARLEGAHKDRELSLLVQRQAWRAFYVKDGWKGAERAPLPGMPAEAAQADGPMPSPAAVLIQLGLQSGDEELSGLAEAANRRAAAAMAEQPFWNATHWLALTLSDAE